MNKLKITLFTILSLVIITIVFIKNKENNVLGLKDKHENFIDNHHYQKTMVLSKEERKGLSLPPNKYLEQEYLLEMNPKTGRPETEKLLALQEEFESNRQNKSVPGNNLNAWVERGPRNVPGRTRAIMYDPNDTSNKRVFAGGVSGGLWVNDDIESGSSSWQRVGISENLAVSSITVDPINPQIMYVGTGESYTGGNINGNGVWQSTDGGTSWARIFGGSSGPSFFNGNASLTVNSPGSIAGVYDAVISQFGPQTITAFTGNLVLVDDGSANPAEGCTALTNAASVNGNIAVIDRGNCFFVDKVLSAQNAGAVAVVVVNNLPTLPFQMGGTDVLNIPAIMISKNDGDIIKNEMLTNTVSVTYEFDDNNDPEGLIVPGIFHINDILTWNNGGNTEVYASVSATGYRDAAGTFIGSAQGLYKSTDDGANWTQVNLPLTSGGNPYEPNDIMIGADNTLWVSTTRSVSFGDGGGTIFSTTNGVNFTERFVSPGGRRVEMASSATDPDKIYLIIQTGTVQIKLTTDGFNTTPTTLPLPVDAGVTIPANDFTRGQSFYDLMLAVDPNNDNNVYVGGIDTFKSSNSGTSWTQMSKWTNGNGQPANLPLVHADIHLLVFHPTNSDKGLIVTDGGAFYASSFASNSIFGRGLDYNTTQFYKGAISQNLNFDIFAGGAQDNGTFRLFTAGSGTANAGEIFGGDGMLCFIDKDNQYIIGSQPNNRFFRFTIGGAFLNDIITQNNGTFVNMATLDDNLDILYTNATAGTSFRITRIKNLSSPQIINLTNAAFTRPPTALKVSPYTTVSSTLFVGTDSGSLLKVTNADTTGVWTDISSSEFSGSISAIDFGANENEIMVTFHNYGVASVWYTEDGGTSWQNKEGDFPDIPVKAIMMNPLLNDEVIIGTDLGVWSTSNFKDANPNWVQSQNGMQNVKVTSFSLRTADNLVLASTYGRGFFTGQFTQFPVGLEDNEISNALNVYPTVSNGNITIASTDVSKVDMQIFDINGRVVYQKALTINNKTSVSLNLEKGIYIANFIGDDLKESHRIIIK